jgi:hypothetical protein
MGKEVGSDLIIEILKNWGNPFAESYHPEDRTADRTNAVEK